MLSLCKFVPSSAVGPGLGPIGLDLDLDPIGHAMTSNLRVMTLSLFFLLTKMLFKWPPQCGGGGSSFTVEKDETGSFVVSNAAQKSLEYAKRDAYIY